MTKRLDVPLDQREVFPVVFGVTSGAFLARSSGNVVRNVKTFARRKPIGDFGVTVEALQRGLPAKFVTAGTVRGTVQSLMWT